MSETRTFEITLPIGLAEEVEARVESGEYESVSELVRDALEEPAGNDAEIERWLRRGVVPTSDRMVEESSRSVPIDDIRQPVDVYITRRQA